jgi:putative hemolysin
VPARIARREWESTMSLLAVWTGAAATLLAGRLEYIADVRRARVARTRR